MTLPPLASLAADLVTWSTHRRALQGLGRRQDQLFFIKPYILYYEVDEVEDLQVRRPSTVRSIYGRDQEWGCTRLGGYGCSSHPLSGCVVAGFLGVSCVVAGAPLFGLNL